MPDNHPPGPASSFFGFALARRFRREPLTFLPELARTYGDVVAFPLGPFQTYFVLHPATIHEVLAVKAKCFRRWQWQLAVLRQWDGNGLLLSEGDFWLRQRRLVQPAFQPRRFGGYVASIVASVERLLGRWENNPGQSIEVVQAMTGLTQEIIAKVLFSVDVSAEVQRLGQAVAILSETGVREMATPLRLPDWLPLPHKRRKRWAMRFLDDTIRRIIRERRAFGSDQGDLLSMLLLAVDDEGDGSGMTDEQARDEAMVLFLAGHDTTAAGLAWIAYLLARHPEVQDRAAREAVAVLGQRAPTADDVGRLSFIEAVVKETLRLYPPAWIWFAREAVADVEIGGYVVPKGGIVYATPWVTHRDARWFPEPTRFDPERFLPGRVETIPAHAWFPFGGGPRVCIGSAFAMTEMILVTASVLRRFRLVLAPGQGEVELSPLLSLRPRGGVQLQAIPRSSTE